MKTLFSKTQNISNVTISLSKQVKLFSSQNTQKTNQSPKEDTSSLSSLNTDFSRTFSPLTKPSNILNSSGTAKDTIDALTNSVLPKVETFVEKRLLEEFSTQLSPRERETALDAYGLRRAKADKAIGSFEVKQKINADESSETKKIKLSDIISDYSGTRIGDLGVKDIGKYFNVPKDKRARNFPFDFFGKEYSNEFAETRSACFMFREESFQLKEAIKGLKTQAERKPIIEAILRELLENEDINLAEQMKYNFDLISTLHQEVSNYLLDFIYVFPDERMRLLFQGYDLFEGIVSQILANFETRDLPIALFGCPELRKDIIKQLMMTYFEKLAPVVKLEKVDFNELDHRISEKDLITYKFYYQVKYKIPEFVFTIDSNKAQKDIESLLNQLNLDLSLDENGKAVIASDFISSTIKLDMVKEKIVNYEMNPEVIGFKDEAEKDKKLRELREERRLTRKNILMEYEPLYKNNALDLHNKNHDGSKFTGFNSNILIHGEGGCGKSGVLSYLYLWARENNWFTVPIFQASKILNRGNEYIEPHANGLLITEKLAKEFLLEMKLLNMEILSTTTYMPDFGTINFAGEKDGAFDTFPTLWDEQREIFTDSWKQFPFSQSIDDIARKYPDQAQRISDFIQPRTLMDIVDFGLENQRFATNAIAEVLQAIKMNKEIKNLTIIDEYNEFLKPSNYYSYRFANNFKSHVPPFALALVRLIVSFDGHLNYNGLKICATSTSKLFKHTCTPEDLQIPNAYAYEVKNLTYQETKTAMYYWALKDCYNWKDFSDAQIEKIFAMTQGNFKEMIKALKFPFDIYEPNLHSFLERKAFNATLRPKNLENIAMSRKVLKEKAKKKLERIEKARKSFINYDYYI